MSERWQTVAICVAVIALTVAVSVATRPIGQWWYGTCPGPS